MNKIFLIATALFFFITHSTSAEVYNKITITGNKRISSESIKVLGNISKEKNYDKKELNDLLKKLYETNFFNDVKININNGELCIVVDENPIIDNIEITGIKNKTFIEDLYENMTLKNRMSYSQ